MRNVATYIPIYLTSYPKRMVPGYTIWLVGQCPVGISLPSPKTHIYVQSRFAVTSNGTSFMPMN